MHTKSIYYLLIAILFFSLKSFAQKDMYAGIEIGSKGIKFSVIDVNNIKKGDYSIIAFWTENVGIAKNISIDGSLAQDDINNAVNIVYGNLMTIKRKYNVADENIFIVGSSGVAMANNTTDLINKIKSLTNKDLDFIDADTEGKMLLKGSIPPTEYGDALILDIGGGNTKGGYVNVLENKFEFFPLNLEYGTITLTEAINKTIVIPSEINSMSVYKEKAFEYAPVLREKIKDVLKSKPTSLNKKKIYLSGGALWAFTTLFYNQNNEDDHFVPLQLQDIIDYDAVLKNNFTAYENLAKTNKNAEKVINTYTQRHLIAANTILIASLESIPNLKSKKIYFAKEGQIAWLVSYVVDRSKKIKSVF
ncbi:Ppx/GppA phosphatase family protein [Flavobacterium hibisci]|uniref:Ppx/GppA phosphatase family protein n=1 Tax=Flavobacterium hibisci TaxID=1914462 RepID=UPI001CBEDB6C|nr:exopolyphosphatase [Flavobacterium hibisci]MBZ4044738.1 exopolyphosphatase [Flavobacterium hibisci]